MMTDALQKEIGDYLHSLRLSEIPSLQSSLLKDQIWESSAFQEIQRSFHLRFSGINKEQAEYYLNKNFNDLFFVERNHIACPLW